MQQIDMIISLPVAKLFSSNVPENTMHTLLLLSSAEFIE